MNRLQWIVLLVSVFSWSLVSCVLLADVPCQTDADCPAFYVCFQAAQCIPQKVEQRIKARLNPQEHTPDASEQPTEG